MCWVHNLRIAPVLSLDLEWLHDPWLGPTFLDLWGGGALHRFMSPRYGSGFCCSRTPMDPIEVIRFDSVTYFNPKILHFKYKSFEFHLCENETGALLHCCL